MSAEISATVLYNDLFYTTLLVSPADLEDFAVGFSLSEGLIARKSQIVALDIVRAEAGLELRIKLEEGSAQRPRFQIHTQGHVNCFCTLAVMSSGFRCESTTARKVALNSTDLAKAFEVVDAGSIRRAAFARAGLGEYVIREDEDSTNAFDKLIGALALTGTGLDSGFVALSGTISLELVQKAATAGVVALAMATTPKAAAISEAKRMNVALVTLTQGRAQIVCSTDRIAITSGLSTASI